MTLQAPSRRTLLLSFAGLGVFGFFWGVSHPLTKVAVSTGHQPFGLIFWQLVFTASWLGLIVAARRLHIGLTRRHLLYYCAIGALGAILPDTFAYLAIQHLPAGIMAIAVATVPIISLTVALIAGNEAFRPTRVVGILLGVSAMIAIAAPETSLPDPAMAPWVLVALIAPVCYGLEGNVVAGLAPDDVHPIASLFSACIFGLLVITPLAWFSGQWIDMSQPWGKAEWALFGSSTAHAAAYAGYMWLIGLAGIVFTSQIAYVVMASAVMSSIVFLGESYSSWVWLAIALMVFCLTLVQPAGKLPDPKTV
ncbi:MAG: DMT family transporter [Oricola sp.]